MQFIFPISITQITWQIQFRCLETPAMVVSDRFSPPPHPPHPHPTPTHPASAPPPPPHPPTPPTPTPPPPPPTPPTHPPPPHPHPHPPTPTHTHTHTYPHIIATNILIYIIYTFRYTASTRMTQQMFICPSMRSAKQLICSFMAYSLSYRIFITRTVLLERYTHNVLIQNSEDWTQISMAGFATVPSLLLQWRYQRRHQTIDFNIEMLRPP